MLSGTRGLGAEAAIQRFVEHVLDVPTLLSMGVGGAAFRLTRLAAARHLLAQPAGILGKGFALRLAAGATGTLVEAPIFTLTGKALRSALGSGESWRAKDLGREVLAGGLFLGSLRSFGFLGTKLHRTFHGVDPLAGGIQRWQSLVGASQLAFAQAGMFTGIRFSHHAEHFLGLAEGYGPSPTLTEDLVTLLQFNFAGKLSHLAMGKKFRAWEQGLDLRLENELSQGNFLDSAFLSKEAKARDWLGGTTALSGLLYPQMAQAMAGPASTGEGLAHGALWAGGALSLGVLGMVVGKSRAPGRSSIHYLDSVTHVESDFFEGKLLTEFGSQEMISAPENVARIRDYLTSFYRLLLGMEPDQEGKGSSYLVLRGSLVDLLRRKAEIRESLREHLRQTQTPHLRVRIDVDQGRPLSMVALDHEYHPHHILLMPDASRGDKESSALRSAIHLKFNYRPGTLPQVEARKFVFQNGHPEEIPLRGDWFTEGSLDSSPGNEGKLFQATLPLSENQTTSEQGDLILSLEKGADLIWRIHGSSGTRLLSLRTKNTEFPEETFLEGEEPVEIKKGGTSRVFFNLAPLKKGALAREEGSLGEDSPRSRRQTLSNKGRIESALASLKSERDLPEEEVRRLEENILQNLKDSPPFNRTWGAMAVMNELQLFLSQGKEGLSFLRRFFQDLEDMERGAMADRLFHFLDHPERDLRATSFQTLEEIIPSLTQGERAKAHQAFQARFEAKKIEENPYLKHIDERLGKKMENPGSIPPGILGTMLGLGVFSYAEAAQAMVEGALSTASAHSNPWLWGMATGLGLLGMGVRSKGKAIRNALNFTPLGAKHDGFLFNPFASARVRFDGLRKMGRHADSDVVSLDQSHESFVALLLGEERGDLSKLRGPLADLIRAQTILRKKILNEAMDPKMSLWMQVDVSDAELRNLLVFNESGQPLTLLWVPVKGVQYPSQKVYTLEFDHGRFPEIPMLQAKEYHPKGEFQQINLSPPQYNKFYPFEVLENERVREKLAQAKTLSIRFHHGNKIGLVVLLDRREGPRWQIFEGWDLRRFTMEEGRVVGDLRIEDQKQKEMAEGDSQPSGEVPGDLDSGETRDSKGPSEAESAQEDLNNPETGNNSEKPSGSMTGKDRQKMIRKQLAQAERESEIFTAPLREGRYNLEVAQNIVTDLNHPHLSVRPLAWNALKMILPRLPVADRVKLEREFTVRYEQTPAWKDPLSIVRQARYLFEEIGKSKNSFPLGFLPLLASLATLSYSGLAHAMVPMGQALGEGSPEGPLAASLLGLGVLGMAKMQGKKVRELFRRIYDFGDLSAKKIFPSERVHIRALLRLLEETHLGMEWGNKFTGKAALKVAARICLYAEEGEALPMKDILVKNLHHPHSPAFILELFHVLKAVAEKRPLMITPEDLGEIFQASRHLEQFLVTKPMFGVFEALLSNGTPEQRDAMAHILGEGAWDHPNPEFNRKAAFILAEIVKKTPRETAESALQSMLEKGLKHFNPRAAHAAAWGLGLAVGDSRFADLTEAIWKRLGVREIQFAIWGDHISTVSAFMEFANQEVPPGRGSLHMERDSLAVQESSVNDFLRNFSLGGPARQLGRSVIYPLAGTDQALVIKYQRADQSKEDLFRESQWLGVLHEIGLQSELPEPVRNREGQLLALKVKGGGWAIAYLAPKNYFQYLNSAEISDEDFFGGLKRAIHDVFYLAGRDVFHTVPIALYHNQEASSQRTNRDFGRYVFAPDIVYRNAMRLGMGRLDNWPHALRYPNMGTTGLRDFEELATREEVLDPASPWMKEFNHAEIKGDKNAHVEAMTLGNALHAAALLIGNRMNQEFKEDYGEAWKDNARLKKFARWLLDLSATAYAARRGISEQQAKNILRPRAHWLRAAKQLAFFMTPAYVPFLKEGAKTNDFPFWELYGAGVRIQGASSHVFGPYRPGSYHEKVGFIGADGDLAALSLGPYNGPYPMAEIEKILWAHFLPEVPEGQQKRLIFDIPLH